MQNFLIIAHKFLPQPDDDLILYLNKQRKENVVDITHSFSDCPDRVSRCKWYKNGDLYREWQSKDYVKYPEVLIYIKEFFFTINSVFKTGIKFDFCVCVDGMCTFLGIFLRSLKKVKKVNYWAMDFVPENRFGSGIKNFFYHKINTFGYKNADEMWDLSPRMADAREEFLGIKKEDYRRHRVVPYGMWLDRIKRYSYEECEKNTLVFMGHLLEKQGVQLVLEAIPEIIRKIPDFKFKVIGTGNYKDKLEERVKELKLENYVVFLGKIEKNEDLEKEIAKSCVAIAPYIPKLDTWTKYADPGKVKTYLGCGVPLLLTDVPWNAKEIEENGCGKIIKEEPADIAKKVIELMDGRINQKYRDNAIKYSESFDYVNIFKEIGL
ncbi:MAG TPA: glycosyltransferase [bacterium]|jgi:glycosyltransferase involved in cell wall biosynthesis|nr:glycosyltransferase [bacterium]